MATDLQTETNRRNALQSTGPRTMEGIEVARFNAVRHGLRALQTVIPGEDPEGWEAHRAGIVGDLKPVGAVELALAEQVAAKLWRLGRVVRHEADLIDISQSKDEILRGHQLAVPKSSFSSFSGTVNRADVPNSRDVKLARDEVRSKADKLKKWEAAYMVLEALEGFKETDRFSKEEWPIYDALKEDLPLSQKQIDSLFKTEEEDFAAHHVRSMLKFKGTVEDVTKGMLTHWRDEKIPKLRKKIERAEKAFRQVSRRYEAALDRLRRSRGLPDEAALDKIQRYEAHLERGLHKALERLQTLQEARGAVPRAGSRPWPWRSSRPRPREPKWVRSAVLPSRDLARSWPPPIDFGKNDPVGEKNEGAWLRSMVSIQLEADCGHPDRHRFAMAGA
jgi:hypothetical protein